MTTSSHQNSSSTPYMPRVLNPRPISFAPPLTEAFTGTANPMPSVPVRETGNIKKSKSKKPKMNEESPAVSTDSRKGKKLKTANDSSPAVSTDSRKGKKLKTDKDSTPSVSSEKRPDWLPEGWIIEERVRVRGTTAGSKDKYYINPTTGRRLRSLVQVRRELNLGDDPSVPNKETNSHKQESSEAGPSNKGNKKRKAEKLSATNGQENRSSKLEDGVNGEQGT